MKTIFGLRLVGCALKDFWYILPIFPFMVGMGCILNTLGMWVCVVVSCALVAGMIVQSPLARGWYRRFKAGAYPRVNVKRNARPRDVSTMCGYIGCVICLMIGIGAATYDMKQECKVKVNEAKDLYASVLRSQMKK